MTLSLNDRAAALADRLAGDAEAARVAVTTLPNGTRLIDCGGEAAGGFEAGRRFAEICMAGLGTVAYAPLVVEGRWLPALTVTTDHPALACLGAQYAGWRLDHEGYFAMASGPGRALIRAEELYDDLDVDEHATAAVLCLETREPPPAEVAEFVAQRAGVPASALTLLTAPTASVAGGVQIAARVVETALHKLHELDFDVRRVARRLRQLPAPAGGGRRRRGDRADQRRGALRRPGPAHGRSRRRRCAARPGRAAPGLGVVGLRRAVHQRPQGRGLRLLRDRPAPVQPGTDQAHERRERSQLRGRQRQPRGPGALVLGLTVAILGSTGGWHAQRLADALAARGHEHRLVPVTRMVGRIDGDVSVRARELWLDGCDAVIVRGIPRGSLEQVIFRVDALHALVERGVTCVNGARAIERTVDKFLATALLARAGLPTPRTIACERPDDALEAFEELGGDVIVKPLFGAMGAGMTRVDDADVAYRVFEALALERAVYYLQEALPHDGSRRPCAGRRRARAGGDRAGRHGLAGEPRARRAGAADGADAPSRSVCAWTRRARSAPSTPASTSLRAADGRDYVLELNGIPGWHGLQAATGFDVAAALVAHLEVVVSEARPARARR